MADQQCPLCGKDAEFWPYDRRMIRGIVCDRCGMYFVSIEAEDWIGVLDRERDKIALLSQVTRERAEQGSPITICSNRYKPSGEQRLGVRIGEMLDTMVPRSIAERMDRALLNLARRSHHPGDLIRLEPDTDYPLLFAENTQAALWLLNQMVQSGLLERSVSFHDGGGDFVLTANGLARAEELTAVPQDSAAAGPSSPASVRVDPGLLARLGDLGTELADSQSQIVRDLNDEERRTTRDCAHAIRELVREVVARLTPDEVRSGTRREKFSAILTARRQTARGAATAEEAAALIEHKSDLLAKWYDRANADSHTSSSRGELQQLWRLADYLLRELLLD